MVGMTAAGGTMTTSNAAQMTSRWAWLAAVTMLATTSTLAQGLPVAAGAFEAPTNEDGIQIAEQPMRGTAFRTLRATLDIQASPAVVLAALWGNGTLAEASASITSREMLVDTPMRRVFFETVEAPLISTRESVLEVNREQDPAHGRYALVFRTIPWPKRPPTGDRVRIVVAGETVAPSAHHAAWHGR